MDTKNEILPRNDEPKMKILVMRALPLNFSLLLFSITVIENGDILSTYFVGISCISYQKKL
jgi:hypothetical protein